MLLQGADWVYMQKLEARGLMSFIVFVHFSNLELLLSLKIRLFNQCVHVHIFLYKINIVLNMVRTALSGTGSRILKPQMIDICKVHYNST